MESDGFQSLAQNTAQKSKLIKNEKKVLKLSRDITKIEDGIKDNKFSKQKLIKKDMRQNHQKPQMLV